MTTESRQTRGPDSELHTPIPCSSAVNDTTGTGIACSAARATMGLFAHDDLEKVTYLLAALTFSGVALAAVVIPARRASRVEPMSALRCE